MMLFIEKMHLKLQLSQNLELKLLIKSCDYIAHFALQNRCFIYLFKIILVFGLFASDEEFWQKLTPWRKN